MSNRRLIVSGSPHIHTGSSVKSRMWGVVIALLPALAFSLYAFGIGALVVIAVSVLGCVMTEYLIQRYLIKGELTITNGSAVITGLLLAMNLPSNLPVWIVLIGCVVAIGLGKYAFGGLGQNIFNPAILGRVFLLISFPQQMTSWPLPMVNRASYLDATTGATILGKMKLNELVPDNVDLMGAFMGQMGGSLGEMCGLAILLGGAYLLVRRIISWHIPVSIIATVALFSWCAGINPLVSILSGGVLLGAVFMATDYVTSPMTHKGQLIYGFGIGLITCVIRLWGAYPEGMSFAILIMNAATPLINNYVKPTRFGAKEKGGKK